MAKVYSWQISQSPERYAYIVHPNDLTKPYIGVELTGDNLQKVIDWASTCTDTEYEVQFNKMKTLCINSNYDVKFEDVTAYINVKTSCDNLRGPAGRGIKSISLYNDDIITNISTYVVEYDDGDTDTFEIRNGRDGVNGINGKDGVPGDTGISSKIIMIYTTGRDGEGNIIVPQRPVGGSYNFATNKVTYPSGWKSNDSELLPPVWMSSRTFNSNGTTDGDWTTPMQITGEQGINGEDGESMEFIFRLDKNEPDTTHLASENTKGYVPIGWTASPCGITETEQTEWCSTRHLDTKTGVWGKWSQATRWAQWGAAGLDGDGIQYIFMRTPKSNPPKNPTPFGYKTDAKYQQKYTEWIPSVGSNYKNLYGDSIIFREGDELWSDDPVEVSNTFPYQWVCTRKYLKEEGNKEKTWQAYSEPALWGKYGENGVSGAIVRVLYCRTDSPSIKPDVPKDAIVYGDWGIAVPEYDTAVQAVWAISAELDATTLEFKEKYNITTNHSDSNLENTLEVVELPVYHLDEYKYIIYKEQYYTWSKSSWSEPYLVSGIKGDSGITPTYTTYVYTYYDAQTLPPKPTNYDFLNPTAQTSNGTIIRWEDFPDTSGGRVDTESKRWYQCIGIVNALTNIVSEWGDVVICNARDGNYTEFRYAVTSGLTAPSLTAEDKTDNEPKFIENGVQKGWYTTSDNIPDVPEGGGMWQIHAVKYKGELTSGSTWSNPVRISGEKGEQGIQGPVGKTGSTGIPGVGITQMYCLGTETEPFGGTEYEQNVVVTGLTGWFDAQHIPSSITIKVNNLDEVKDYAKNEGRVICVITQNKKEDIEHQYYRIENGKVIELTEKILKDEDDFGVYIWCIQGSDIYSHNASADTYTRTGIRWSLPFKIQGSNGLRGFTGSRGQVVYPMGVYNPNEVYKTTETKAPYVYDPNDGMYYVYNIVGAPWVGVLPEGYKTIKDKDGNFKYSLDGTGNANTWMSDRNGETPANDYANAVKPSWVRFDSYDAIYTSIGIIANGMIGSAVYNNEFMFSQQGVNTSGAPCNYADNGVEFLSGYEYDEKGNSYGYHWKYKGTSTYIKDINVNPYELNNNKPIHTFRPNVCINFATGQMWLACGKIVLGQSEVNFYTSSETNNQISGANSALENKLSGLIDKNKQEIQQSLGDLQNAFNDVEDIIKNTDRTADIYYSATDPSSGWTQTDKVGDKIGDLWFNTNKDISYIFCTGYTSSSIESAFSKKYTSVSPKYYWRPTSVPQSIFDTIDGKAQVFVTEPASGTSYNKCDLWFVDKNYGSTKFYNNITGITSGMCLVCMQSGVVSGNTWYQDWAKADDYLTQAQTESLIESNTKLLEQALKDYVDDIKQTDGKADAYYSDKDPSSGWSQDDASIHIGDIWFHSVSGISYVYCNEAEGNYINSKQSGYYWRTTDIPKEIYDVVDGYAQIFIARPQPPYHIGDLWFVEDNSYSGTTFHGGTTGITSGTCMVAIEDSTGTTINYTDWAKRDSYATEATIKQIENAINKDVNDFKSSVSALTNTLEENINKLQQQVDKKVNTYYSDDDPSSGFTNASEHIGDMWYNTKDGIAYEFCDEDGNGYNISSKIDGYYWRPSNVPSGLFDKLDGFAQVFIAKPTVAYEPGDLWYIRTNEYSAQTFYHGVTGVTSGSCLVCVSGNINSTPLTNFQFTDWATLEYADIAQLNNAISRLNEFGSDNLITPNEMKTLKEEWGRISGDTTILNLLAELGIQEDGKTGDIHKNFRIGFAKAEAAYAYFTDTKNATAGVNHDSIPIPPSDLGPIYSSNDAVYYNYSSISEYYRIKQATTEAINNAINKKATNSQQKIEYWGRDNLINPSEVKLLLKEYQKFKEEHKTIEELLRTYDVDVDSDGYYYSYEETELEDGSIQKPSDATEQNVENVTEVPKEKISDISKKYLKCGDHYYTWQYSYQNAYEKAVFAYDYFTTISNANSATGCIVIPTKDLIGKDLTGNDVTYNYSSITHYYVAKEHIIDKFNKITIKTEVEFKVGLSAITATVQQHTDTISGYDDKIGQLSVAYDNINAQVERNTSDISGYSTQIGELNVSYSGITSNVTDIQNRLSGITTQVSQIEQKADKIELSVSSMSVGGVNILDRTDFESISAITSSNTDSTKFEILNKNLTNVSSFIKDGLSNADSKILVITAQNGASNTTSESYVDVIQNVTGKLKSNTTYTLHCKYKPSYKQHDLNNKTVAGALYLTNTYPTSMEVNGNEILVVSDLCVDLSGDTDSWNSVVLKFKTGTLSSNTSMFFIRTFIGSNIELCNLKLEEGTIPTVWSKSPKDVSAEIGISIKDGISDATIRADQVTICGETIFNDNIKISKDGTLEAKNGNFSGSISADTGYFNGDLNVQTIKYHSNERTQDGVLNCSCLYGGGEYILPHLTNGETMRITAFFPVTTRGGGEQKIFAFSDGTSYDILQNNQLENSSRCGGISNQGWVELVGVDVGRQTIWYYNVIGGGVEILSYYSQDTLVAGSPYPANPIKYSYIWFYIKITDERGRRVEHYTAYEGTTWESWVQTSFNYGNYVKNGNSIVYKGTSYSIYNGTTTVQATDKIINTNMYSLYIPY